VVFGDAPFLSDDVVSHDVDNLALGLAAVSWLAQDESLASIKVKSGAHRAFVFNAAWQQTLVTYGDQAIVVIIPLLWGLWFFLRRRAHKQWTYTARPIL
jgi:hypothetical protein